MASLHGAHRELGLGCGCIALYNSIPMAATPYSLFATPSLAYHKTSTLWDAILISGVILLS
jgi:hypothetical protein